MNVRLSALAPALALAFAATAQAQAQAPDARLERWLARAEAALETGRPTRARRLLARAQDARPADPRAARLGARLLPGTAAGQASLSERVAADARWLREAIAAADAPEDPLEARALLRADAWAQALLGAHREAVAELPVGPQDLAAAELLRRMATLFVLRDDLLHAERALARAHRALPQDPLLLRELSALHVARGRPDRAVRALLDRLRTAPADLAARRALASALLAAGRGEAALGELRRIVDEAAPEDAPADALRLAAAALELGRAEEAEEAARRALAATPSPRGHALLGLALVAQGRRDEARAALRRAPDDLRARRALEALEAPRP